MPGLPLRMKFASNPAVRSALVKQTSEFGVTRVQLNFVARRERQILNWMCARLPEWVTPDTLTGLSIVGAVVVFASYLASRDDRVFLWFASLGFALNWLGDSLDGSLARYRRIERPTYGYFLDHTVDALNNLVMMVGLGFTIDVRMDVALFALVGYYLLCMYVFINNHLSGVFQLSFLGFGPTELRICLILINTAMFYYGSVGWLVGGSPVSIYDAIILFAGSAFVGVFVIQIFGGIRKLRASERSARKAPPPTLRRSHHSLATKASSWPK